MKILCVLDTRNDNVLRISSILKKLGHQVGTMYTDPYTRTCSYGEKKIYKAGIQLFYKKYMTKWKQDFQNKLEQLNPELILFVDFRVNFISLEEILSLRKKYFLVLWLVDSIARGFGNELNLYFRFFSKVWCFETKDVLLLKEKYQVNAEYLPVGYNDAYQNVFNNREEKLYDIGFVGAPYYNRLVLLEYILEQTNATAKICGPFYSERYFWKKIQFKKHYPYIFKYLDNRFYSPKEVAEVYIHSKICLNINQKDHHGISPRTYDIMATGAFELLDERTEYGPVLKPGENIIIFNNKDDLLKKVRYYLSHNEERENIARRGWNVVYNNMSMVNTLITIINSAEVEKERKNLKYE